MYKFLVFFLIIVKVGYSQDPHFTQYYSSQLLINPALTGFFNGDYRVSSCYRNQWPNIQYPYTTGVISVDANILKGVIKDGDIMGLGFTTLFDNSNNGGLKYNFISGSFSFHKLLDPNGIQRIGVGAMATYNTKLLDYNKFVFSQQITPQGFDSNLPTGEKINGFSTNYVDYSVGILYSAITDYSSFYCGASMYRFNQPTESFNGPVHVIKPKYVGNIGGFFEVNENNKLFLSAAYMSSEYSNDLIFGTAFSKSLAANYEDNYNLIIGGWYRYKDAVSPYLGIEYKNYRAGISYDINVSKLQTATNLRGGFELSFSYIFTRDPDENVRKQSLCPKGPSQLRWFGY